MPHDPRDQIASALPPEPGFEEPAGLRQDILDELTDHLHCAAARELRTAADESAAWRAAIERFGDPARIARTLWLHAMKERIMNQRLLIGTNVAMLLVAVILVAAVLVALRQNQRFQESLMERVTALASAPPAGEPAAMPAPTEVAAFSWPRVLVEVRDAEEPLSITISGEPYNPGERIALHGEELDGRHVFGPMRPGKYRLHVVGPSNIRLRRDLIVPPGADREELVHWPRLVPQPTEVAIDMDLLAELRVHEDLADSVATVAFAVSPADAPEWSWTSTFIAIDARGYAAVLTEDDLRWFLDAQQIDAERAERHPPPLDWTSITFAPRVTIDASFRYRPNSLSLYVRRPFEEDGTLWRALPNLQFGRAFGPDSPAMGPEHHAAGRWELTTHEGARRTLLSLAHAAGGGADPGDQRQPQP
jgi:hypothetical protein